MPSNDMGTNQRGGWFLWKSRMALSIFCGVLLAIAAISSCRNAHTATGKVGQQQAVVAQTKPHFTLSGEERSCQKFVQEFYDWYVFHMLDDECKKVRQLKEQDFSGSCKGAARFRSISAMSLKEVLTPKLKRLQDEEATIQMKEGDAGLDFDEYLNSQDPSPKYEVESVQSKGGHCDAVVNGIEEGQKRERLMPELVKIDGKWVFVNFHYHFDMGEGKPAVDDDLVSMLKRY